MNKLSNRTIGWIYAYIHFTVEVVCFRWFYLHAHDWDVNTAWTYALLYDCLAFVPQALLGRITDRYPKLRIGPVGVALLAVGMFTPWNPLALLLLTAGNCALHVSGANASLRGANGKLGPSGIFVAGGSVGVVLGTLLGRYRYSYAPVLLSILLIAAFWLTMYLCNHTDMTKNAEGFHIAADKPVLAIILLTFFVVCARSYVGYAIPIGWKKEDWQTVMLFLCMALGKGAGGVLADRFGARITAVMSLTIALPLLCFGNSLMLVSLLGVALFSMTMAISLGALVSVMPREPGRAFGITTVALFLGSLPRFFVKPEGLTAQIMIVVVLSLAAILCCMLSLRGRRDKEII